MNVWRVRAFFFFFFFSLQFKRPQIFCRAKLFMYSNESDFEDIFSFLLLFHEFRVHPSEGFGQNCLRLLAVKVLAERDFKKRFRATSWAPCSNIILYISVVAQFLFPTCGRACGTVPISFFHLVSLLFWTSTRLSGCCPVRVCMCVCACITVMPQYVFPAPWPQICAAHFAWQESAMGGKRWSRCTCVDWSFFFFLELKRYKIFSCLPEIRDAMILFPATRTKTSEALLRSRLEFLLLWSPLSAGNFQIGPDYQRDVKHIW